MTLPELCIRRPVMTVLLSVAVVAPPPSPVLPGDPVPATVLITKVTIKGAAQAVQMFGPAQDAVARAYAAHPNLAAEVHAFLDDMPARIAAADLVVSRAGATTNSRRASVGRAEALVFPFIAM